VPKIGYLQEYVLLAIVCVLGDILNAQIVLEYGIKNVILTHFLQAM
jgi:hypothetical protein